jgi:hypothetical protein
MSIHKTKFKLKIDPKFLLAFLKQNGYHFCQRIINSNLWPKSIKLHLKKNKPILFVLYTKSQKRFEMDDSIYNPTLIKGLRSYSILTKTYTHTHTRKKKRMNT